jgi:polysaccharide transporter, PST family
MSVQSKKRIKVWEGAFILTIAGLLTKILSAGYRIPYQNIVGDIGFYIYQQIYPLYGIALVLSTTGFPVVISKMIAEKYEQRDYDAVEKIIWVSMTMLVIIGISGFLILYKGSTYIATLMGDQELEILIKVISFSFLLLPFISISRGYYQGKRTMVPTAVSQISEQVIRVITILLLSFMLLKQGYDQYITGAGAIFGSISGGFAALFVLTYFFVRGRNRLTYTNWMKSTMNTSEIVKVFLGQGFTICISGLLLILIQLVDALTLYSELVSSGIGENIAKQIKGIYDRGQPLIQLGTVVATSLSLSLVPLISSAKARNDYAFINDKINLSFRVSIVVGLGASLGLASIIKPTNIMLFKDSSGSFVLMILGLSILFTSLSLTLAAILQGLGSSLATALIVLVGVVVKYTLNVLLIPSFETVGAGVSTLLAYMTIVCLQILMIRIKGIKGFVNLDKMGKIIIASLMMVITIISYLTLLNFIFQEISSDSRLFSTFAALTALLVGGGTFLFVVLRIHIFNESELLLIPGGDKLTTILNTNNRRR